MDGIKAFGLAGGEVNPAYGTDLESFILDTLDDPAGDASLDGVWFDDCESALGHPAIIAVATSATPARNERPHTTTRKPAERKLMMNEKNPQGASTGADPDASKGAVEGDRPEDAQQGNPNGTGIDRNGLPNDPVATAEDAIGANVDESEGG
jgi:hypothetical protein